MHRWRNLVKLIVGTLAAKLALVDDDGLDLKMATKTNLNIDGANPKSAQAEFEKAIDDAFASKSKYRTDMDATLDEIFQNYLLRTKDYLRTQRVAPTKLRSMTLLVITDGIWDGPLPEGRRFDKVGERIATFIRELKLQLGDAYLGVRRFTIQFIRVGNDKEAMNRLNILDNELRKETIV
jgi:hypothetical protein